MADRGIPYSRALTVGWETFKTNVFFLVGLVVAVGALNAVLDHASDYSESSPWVTEVIVRSLAFLVNCLIELGVINIMLKFVDGKSPEFADLFNRIELAFPFAVATVLYFVMVAIGLILLIVPGIYLAVRFCFYGYFIVDEACGPLEALDKSARLTEGVRMELFLFGLILVGINIIGAAMLLVGLIITMPVAMLAAAFVFRHLRGLAPAAGAPPEPAVD